MATEVTFQVSWHEFNAIMKLGGSTGYGGDWTSYALKRAPDLRAILGDRRAAELVVHIESGAVVQLVPTPGSRVSQTKMPSVAKTLPSPPPTVSDEEVPTKVEKLPPLPFPPSTSRIPPKDDQDE
jgi:hypothetical protein